MDTMDNNQSTHPIVESSPHPLNQVTVVSKYLALALFISLPFLGGYVGYSYAPEKIIELEKVVKNEQIKTPAATEGYSDLYTYDLPTGWFYTESEAQSGKITALSPLKIKESYLDESGYFHYANLSVYIQHLSATNVFNENETFMTSRWPGEYATLLSAIYRKDDEFGQQALSSLGAGIFPATLFETENQRFKGVSRINAASQDYGFWAKYELLLIDTLYGDMIVLSIDLDGKELTYIRSLLATQESDKGEREQALQEFLNLLNSKSREELSFGYLMNDLENFAHSFKGVDGRDGAARIYTE